MKAFPTALIVALFVLFGPFAARADGKRKAIQELVEFLSKKAGKEGLEGGAAAFTRRLESAAIKHGDDVLKAVRQTGPRGLALVETAAAGQGGKAASLMAKHGEHAATWVVGRPSAMKLVARHGDEAAECLVKHSGGIAEPLIEKFGRPAVEAFTKLTPQAGRKMAMLADDAAPVVAHSDFWTAAARYGDRFVDFCWKHRLALASTAVLAAVLKDPEPYLNGVTSLADVAAARVAEPMVHATERVAERAVERVAPEIGKNTNWTVVFLAAVGGVVGLIGVRRWGTRAAATKPPGAP